MASMIKKGYDENGLRLREFLDILISDDDLCKALLYTDEKFYNNTITKEQKKSLIGVHIHPDDYIPDVVTDAKAFITMKFEFIPSKTNGKTNDLLVIGRVVFYCFCHKDIKYIDHIQLLRSYYIASRLRKLLDDKHTELWLNKLEFVYGGDVKKDSLGTYIGTTLVYESIGFN